MPMLWRLAVSLTPKALKSLVLVLEVDAKGSLEDKGGKLPNKQRQDSCLERSRVPTMHTLVSAEENKT